MADRGLDVLEKYDFEVKRTKGRGVIMVDTDKGQGFKKLHRQRETSGVVRSGVGKTE